MAPPQVPQITTQHPVPSSEISTTPIEMTDTRASPWLSGDRRWRDSGSSGPKTPVLRPTQEMERIEAVLVGTPPTTTRAQGSSNRSSRQWIATPPGPNSPVSPTDRTGMEFSQSQTAAPTAPAAAMTRQTAMLQISDSVQRLQNGQLVTTTLSDVVLSDVEAQERPRGPRGPVRKKWWWQKPRWKGVQNRLITAVIAGIMCLIVLTICE
jgi:CCR4-NOT transcriptional regulation complex NOT5 subunit